MFTYIGLLHGVHVRTLHAPGEGRAGGRGAEGVQEVPVPVGHQPANQLQARG